MSSVVANRLSHVSLIVLAAGLSVRFGSDKLSAEFRGQALATHLLPTLTKANWLEKIVVAKGQGWTAAFADAGFGVLTNPAPQRGLGSSLQLGLDGSGGEHVMICLADMPFITIDHLLSLLDTYDTSASKVVASRAGSYRGPPFLFNRRCLTGVSLQGDRGARDLLGVSELVDDDPMNLRDIDTVKDLIAAQSP